VEFRQAVCKIFNVRYQRSHSRTDGLTDGRTVRNRISPDSVLTVAEV